MAEEIEFETPAEVVTENKKLESLEAKVASLEAKLGQILSAIEELKKVKETVKEDNSLKNSVISLTKKVEELESKPARITQTLSENTDPGKKVKEFLNQVSGGEMLVYAEKKGIKWGKGE